MFSAEVTGIGVDVDNIDLDGDFDPARYDQAMQVGNMRKEAVSLCCSCGWKLYHLYVTMS